VGAAAVLARVTWTAVVMGGSALGRLVATSGELVSVALAPVSEPYQPAPSVLVDPSALADAPNPARASRGRRRH
jgi:hypothetical protein